MRHPRIIIASISLAAVAAIGGVTAAATAASTPASSAHSAGQNAAATVRTAQAAVAGKTESILVNAQGLPLYYYRPDTATKSLVSAMRMLQPDPAPPRPRPQTGRHDNHQTRISGPTPNAARAGSGGEDRRSPG
jgi:hypothetical protein